MLSDSECTHLQRIGDLDVYTNGLAGNTGSHCGWTACQPQCCCVQPRPAHIANERCSDEAASLGPNGHQAESVPVFALQSDVTRSGIACKLYEPSQQSSLSRATHRTIALGSCAYIACTGAGRYGLHNFDPPQPAISLADVHTRNADGNGLLHSATGLLLRNITFLTEGIARF